LTKAPESAILIVRGKDEGVRMDARKTVEECQNPVAGGVPAWGFLFGPGARSGKEVPMGK